MSRGTLLTPALLAALAATTLAGAPAAAQSAVTVTITLTVTATATVNVAKVQAETKSAIQGFLSNRANLLTTSGPSSARAHGRLGGGTLFGGVEENAGGDGGPAPGYANDRRGSMRSRAGLGGFARQGSLYGFGGSSFGGGTMSGGGMSGYGGMMMGPGWGPGSFGPGYLSDFERNGPDANNHGHPFAVPYGWQPGAHDGTFDAGRSRASGFRFSGNAEDGFGRFAFAGSLSQMRAAAEAEDREKRLSVGPKLPGATTSGQFGTDSAVAPQADASSPGATGYGLSAGQGTAAGASTPDKPGSIDVWVEATSSYFSTDRIDGRRQGHAAIAHVGADVVVMPGLLFGVMASYDWMAETTSGLAGGRDGHGWMMGPYLSARLTRNLYFDVRYAWGQSSNQLDPLGAYVDTFSTTRQLASGKLTGDWRFNEFRFRPSAEVIWFTETQHGYENAIGITIASQTFNLGRAVIGPEIGYMMVLSDNSVLEPYVGLKGVWDFSGTGLTTAAGTPVGADELRARAEVGLSYRTPSGIVVQGSGAYDGLGSDDYRAIQGQARVVVPLQ